MLPTFSLTADQQAAKEAFNAFLCDQFETVFVLKGYSGTGKSTLVRTLLTELPDFMRIAKLVNPDMREYQVQLTATTNKAAENLRQISGEEVKTIASFLHLRVQTDFKTRQTKLVPRDGFIAEGFLLFIDEASFIDQELLQYIYARTRNCKIVFMGDSAQLLNVGCVKPPVFNGKYSGAELREVVRQAEGNPIVELSTQFRHTVNTGVWPKFRPDGHHIQWLERDAFNQAIVQEFGKPGWKYADSKILSYTNKCAIAFNKFVRSNIAGSPHFEVGDYAVCNSYVTHGKNSIQTDRLVQINHIGEDTLQLDVPGNVFTVDGLQFFMPKTLELRNARLKRAKAEDDGHTVATIDESWIDLRAAFACTTNKSQGSTYDQVFIDLDDMATCTSGDQLARLLYVSVSRARSKVVMTGDLA